jgi:hypothetical protein
MRDAGLGGVRVGHFRRLDGADAPRPISAFEREAMLEWREASRMNCRERGYVNEPRRSKCTRQS